MAFFPGKSGVLWTSHFSVLYCSRLLAAFDFSLAGGIAICVEKIRNSNSTLLVHVNFVVIAFFVPIAAKICASPRVFRVDPPSESSQDIDPLEIHDFKIDLNINLIYTHQTTCSIQKVF